MKQIIKSGIEQISKKMEINLEYYLKNSFWMGLRQVIEIIAGLGLFVAFARLATQEVFGQYQFILAILSTISIFSIPGLNASIIQSAARRYEGSYKKAIKISFLWSLLGIPTLLIIGGYYYIYQSHILGSALMLASVFFPFLYAPNTWDAFFIGKERFDLSAKYASIQAIINAIALISILFLFENNLLAIIFVYLISLTIFNVLWFWKSLKYIKNKKEDKETIKYGWFVTKINVIEIISGNFDKILIGVLLTPADLAIYIIGINLAKKFLNFIKSFLTIASPKISRVNTLSFRRYLNIFVILSIFAIGLYFIFPILIPSLFSTKYIDSIFLSQIIIIFLPLYILNILYKNHFLLYLKNKKILLQESIIFPTIKILLMIPLLHFFGIKGLAFLVGFQFLLDIIILYLLSKPLHYKQKFG